MDFSKLIRDPARVKKGLTETEDKQLIALRECKIYFPVRFEEQEEAINELRKRVETLESNP